MAEAFGTIDTRSEIVRIARLPVAGHTNVAERPLADPDAAARKLVEIANATEAVQNGRIYIELVNGAFLAAGGSPSQRPSSRKPDRSLRAAFGSAQSDELRQNYHGIPCSRVTS